MSNASATTKKFGKGERTIPHHTNKASRFYPAHDEKQPKKVCNSGVDFVLQLRHISEDLF